MLSFRRACGRPVEPRLWQRFLHGRRACLSGSDLERLSVALLQTEMPVPKPVRLPRVLLSALQYVDDAEPQLALPMLLRYVTSFSSRSMRSICPDRIFDRAASRSNHSARSISGKAWRRPLLGGHSISKVLLDNDDVSKLVSP